MKRTEILAILCVPLLAVPSGLAAESFSAQVTDKDGVSLMVEDIVGYERASGNWLGTTPSHTHREFFYQISKKGVEIHRSIPYLEIASIEFRSNRSERWDAVDIVKRDGSTIVVHAPWGRRPGTVEITSPSGKKTLERFEVKQVSLDPAFNLVLTCGDYRFKGFSGRARVEGETGDWSRNWGEVRKIEFLH